MDLATQSPTPVPRRGRPVRGHVRRSSADRVRDRTALTPTSAASAGPSGRPGSARYLEEAVSVSEEASCRSRPGSPGHAGDVVGAGGRGSAAGCASAADRPGRLRSWALDGGPGVGRDALPPRPPPRGDRPAGGAGCQFPASRVCGSGSRRIDAVRLKRAPRSARPSRTAGPRGRARDIGAVALARRLTAPPRCRRAVSRRFSRPALTVVRRGRPTCRPTRFRTTCADWYLRMRPPCRTFPYASGRSVSPAPTRHPRCPGSVQ
jgi:hypothetical protein